MSNNASHRYNQSVILLLFTTLIWGTTFPLLKNAIDSLSPSALIGSRFLVAALACLPFGFKLNRRLVRDGIILGTLLFTAFTTQVIGLESTSASRAAFITSMNVILIPLIEALMGRSVSLIAFLSAFLALAGIGVMSWEGGSLNIGDLWVFGCAVCYAIYILVLEVFASRHNSIKLTALQLFVVAVLGTIWAAPELVDQIRAIKANFVVILYLGIVATAAVTWTQAFAQQWVPATQTAIIYTLEPVFAAIFSFLLLRETMGVRGFLGASMILVSILLSQIRR
ncbi:DMT family transporter [Nostoc sp. NMS4]|uniref:DMT family transporter n=1 Tax=Nostoc sp. NMS4 TaxID=2815390 RepID=UPI0025F0D949|nr:DMT family transporter [Nostoc sp. NMS4]MBN3926950.1 DMT family transporter [Nostoc sp. NMS4]